jgi:hypothetical protein
VVLVQWATFALGNLTSNWVTAMNINFAHVLLGKFITNKNANVRTAVLGFIAQDSKRKI